MAYQTQKEMFLQLLRWYLPRTLHFLWPTLLIVIFLIGETSIGPIMYFLIWLMTVIVVMMSFTFVHYQRLCSIGNDFIFEDYLNLRQERTFHSSLKKDEIIDRLSSVFGTNKENNVSNVVKFKNLSWFGLQKITLEFLGTQDVKVTCQPLIELTFINFGESFINIRKIERLLR